MPLLNRRGFLSFSTIAAGSGVFAGLNGCKAGIDKEGPDVTLDSLAPLTGNVIPIGIQEKLERINKAQRLMIEQKIAALVLDCGTSLEYFTGVRWWPSERPMVVIIPFQGGPIYICPAFEEDRLRQLVKIGNEFHVWQEDENPYSKIAVVLDQLDTRRRNVGVEERVRFFIFDGIRKELPHLEYVSGDPISVSCRLIKSKSEIALMKKANEITVAAIKSGIKFLQEGVSPAEFSAFVANAHQKFGAEHDFAMANFGEASAFPHGSIKPQKLKKGDVVLMDCGCRVEGYCADISRTIVFGASPTKRQLDVWNLEKRAQAAGFEAAKIGSACEEVDKAARDVLIVGGFGPGYKVPGLPHRTGHGIGLDGHEWGNMVKGNKLLLDVGMCFSIEPTIAIPGEFGVRLEDCAFIGENGCEWFSKPSPSIEEPFYG